MASTANARGGVWRHIEDLGLALQRAGLEVTIGLLPGATVLHHASERAGLPWEPLRRSLRGTIDLWHLHLHDTYDRRALPALAARRMFGPSVITEHLPHSNASDERLEPQFPRTRFASETKTLLKRLEFALTSAVIAVSENTARFLEERYSLSAGTVTTVRPGLTAPEYPAGPRRPDGRMRVVAVGSFGRQKGHDVLLEAVCMSARDWELTLVGDGAQRERLHAIASGLPGGRVRFAGWVADPRPHVLSADVFCMPSRWESLPYAVLEACALSRAVVASRVDGMDEVVVHGETGILVPPDSPGELAAALDHLAANRRLAVEYGLAAHARVRRYFTLSAMVDGMIAAYSHAHRR